MAVKMMDSHTHTEEMTPFWGKMERKKRVNAMGVWCGRVKNFR